MIYIEVKGNLYSKVKDIRVVFFYCKFMCKDIFFQVFKDQIELKLRNLKEMFLFVDKYFVVFIQNKNFNVRNK